MAVSTLLFLLYCVFNCTFYSQWRTFNLRKYAFLRNFSVLSHIQSELFMIEVFGNEHIAVKNCTVLNGLFFIANGLIFTSAVIYSTWHDSCKQI